MATLDYFMKNQADSNTVYSVGASTNYFFIGTKDEYEKEIDLVNKAKLDYLIKNRNSAIHSLEYAKEHPPVKEKTQSVWQNGKKVEVTLSVKEQTVMWKEEIKQLEKTVSNYDRRLKKFKPIRERKIEHFYQRLNPADGMILIVSGDTEGSFWFRKEYQKIFKEGRVEK